MIQLVTSRVQFFDFMKEFIENTQHYIQHAHVSRWKDENFRICRDTFPIGTVLPMVDFAEKYTLQPQNEIQCPILSLRAGRHNGPYHIQKWNG
jgi:hypothetical protein